MPQVPYQPFTEKTSQERPTPLIHLNVPADAFGESIGRAVSGLGAKMDQVGNELWGRAVAMQELKNETEVTNSLSDMETQSAQLRANYFNTQGLNAVNGYDDFIASQNKIRDDIRNGLSNDMARKMFDRTALGVTNRAMIAAASHSAQELRKANQQADVTGIDAEQQAAAYSANEDEFNMHLGLIKNKVLNRSADMGWDQGTTDDNVFRAQSGAYTRRIMEVSRDNPTLAAQMMKQAFDDKKIHTADMDRLENRVNTQLNNAGSRTIARNTLDEANDPSGVYRQWFPNANIHGMNPDFQRRFYSAVRTYENETGHDVGVINGARSSVVRTTAEQEEIYNRSLREGFLAARPGHGNHEDTRGEAIDVARGPLLDWLHDNAGRFGLHFLRGWRPGEERFPGENTPFRKDPVHIELTRGARQVIENPVHTAGPGDTLSSIGSNFDVPPEEIAKANGLDAGATITPGQRLKIPTTIMGQGEAPTRYQIPESLIVDTARRRAEAIAPNNQTFVDNAISRTMGDFRQQRSQEFNYNLQNLQTIDDEILNKRPKTLEDLLSRSPDARQAYDNITDPRVKMRIERSIRTSSNVRTPEQQQNFFRLQGMSQDTASLPEFANTNLDDPDLDLNDKDRQALRLKQIQINNRTYANDPKFVRAMSIVRPFIPLDIQKNVPEYRMFQGAFMESIQDWQRQPENKGKYPTPDELKQMAREIILQPAPTKENEAPSLFESLSIDKPIWGIPGWAFSHNEKRDSLLMRSQSIPREEEQAVREELTSRGMLAPSAEDVRRAWIIMQLDALKKKPTAGEKKPGG